MLFLRKMKFYIAGVVDAKPWLEEIRQHLPRVFFNTVKTKVFPPLVNSHVENLSDSGAVFLPVSLTLRPRCSGMPILCRSGIRTTRPSPPPGTVSPGLLAPELETTGPQRIDD